VISNQFSLSIILRKILSLEKEKSVLFPRPLEWLNQFRVYIIIPINRLYQIYFSISLNFHFNLTFCKNYLKSNVLIKFLKIKLFIIHFVNKVLITFFDYFTFNLERRVISPLSSENGYQAAANFLTRSKLAKFFGI